MSSCCTPDGSCHSGSTDQAVVEGVTTVFAVSGMTCGHCKSTLTKEIGGLSEVLAVEVDLDQGHVSVTTKGEPDEGVLAKVVDDAGYELTGRV
jgi:copper chaperone CopZ